MSPLEGRPARSEHRASLFWIIAGSYVAIIFLAPIAGLVALGHFTVGYWSLALAVASPAAWATMFALLAGLLSRSHQRFVQPGEFPIDVGTLAYFHRRLYGLCWTAVFYSGPVYFVLLSFPPLKTMLLRLFGYRGHMDFTVYPDTWIRDLTVLSFGKGAYLSNKATLGSNIVLSNGHILVDRIELGERALIGHLAIVGAGLRLGAGAEIGVGAAVGIQTHIGENSAIGPCCAIEHAVRIGKNTRVGTRCYVGTRAVLGDGLVIPPGTVIPPRCKLRTQAEVYAFIAKTGVTRVESVVDAASP